MDNRIDESDSLSLFLKERLRKSDVGSLTTKLILDCYSSFCREHGWGFPGEQTVFRRLNDLMTSLFEAQPTKHIKKRQARGRARIPRCVSQFNKATGQHRRFDQRWRQRNPTSSNLYQIQPQSTGKVPERHIARDEQLCGLRVAPFVVERLPGGITDPPKIGLRIN